MNQDFEKTLANYGGDTVVPTTTEDLLAERGKRYGDYTNHARIAQDIKSVLRHYGYLTKCKPDQIETLDMIAHKIGRILNGDPEYADNFADIAGYAKLSADRCTR